MIKEKMLQIIEAGEGLRTEFKECRNSIPKNLYETVCAFLNRHGGEILLGVNNRGKITGIDKESIDKIQSDFTTTINNPGKISPSVYLSIEQVQIDGRLVLYIYIPESSQVHKCKGRIYDRNLDGDFDITDNHQLVTSLYINKQTFYTENRVYPYCDIADLDSELLARARRQAVLLRNNHPWQSMDDFEMLKSAQVYTKDYQSGREGFTLAAMLLFGKDQTILSALPHHRTDLIVRRENVDRYDDRDDVRTNLLDSYDRITAFAQKHLPDPFYLEGSQRISIRDAIIREVASNILIHREYMNAFPAKIIIERTRIYAENSNKPHGTGPINPDKFTPYPKNPVIARFFKEIGLADELGSGVRNLVKFVKIYSQSKPQLIEEDIFKISIPVLPQRGDAVSRMIIKQDERMRTLLEYCRKARTRDEIQSFLKLKNRDYVRNFIIKPLLENNLLYLTSPENPSDPRQQYYSPSDTSTVTEGVTPPVTEGVTPPVTEGVTPSNSSKNGSALKTTPATPPVTEGATMQATMQATPPVTPPVTEGVTKSKSRTDNTVKMLMEFCRVPRNREEIQSFLQLKNKKYVLNRYIRPLVEKKALFYTLPQTPNAPGQMYYSTLGVPEVINDEEMRTRKQKILLFCSISRSAEEIMEYINLTHKEHFRSQILNPLLKDGLLKLTIPDKPNHPGQKYITDRP